MLVDLTGIEPVIRAFPIRDKPFSITSDHLPYLDLLRSKKPVPELVVEFCGRPLLYFVSHETFFSLRATLLNKALGALTHRLAMRGDHGYVVLSRSAETQDLEIFPIAFANRDDELHPREVSDVRGISLLDIATLAVEGLASFPNTKYPGHNGKPNRSPRFPTSRQLLPRLMSGLFDSLNESSRQSFMKEDEAARHSLHLIAAALLIRASVDRPDEILSGAMLSLKKRLDVSKPDAIVAALQHLARQFPDTFGLTKIGDPRRLSEATAHILASTIFRQPKKEAVDDALGWADLDFALVPAHVICEASSKLTAKAWARLRQTPRDLCPTQVLPFEVPEFLLDDIYDLPPEAKSVTVVDPECGSGLFLVSELRRQVRERWRSCKGDAIYEQWTLRLTGHDTLLSNICFADMALTIAQIELSGAPPMPLATIELSLTAVNSDAYEKSISELRRNPADLAIGALSPSWVHSADRFMPSEGPYATDIGQLSLLRRICKPEAPFAVTVNSRLFHNLEPKWVQARATLFSELNIGGITDFTMLARSRFFPDASPLCAVIGLNRPPHPSEFAFWHNPTPRLYDRKRRLALGDDSRAQPLEPDTFNERPWIARALAAATSSEIRALDQVGRAPSLEDQCRQHDILISEGRSVLTSGNALTTLSDLVVPKNQARLSRLLDLEDTLLILQTTEDQGASQYPILQPHGRLLFPREFVGFSRLSSSGPVQAARWMNHVMRIQRSAIFRAWITINGGDIPGSLRNTLTVSAVRRFPIPDLPPSSLDDPWDDKYAQAVYGLSDIDYAALVAMTRRLTNARREKLLEGASVEEQLSNYSYAVSRELSDFYRETTAPMAIAYGTLGPWALIAFDTAGMSEKPRFNELTDRLAINPHLSEQWIQFAERRSVLARHRLKSQFNSTGARYDAIRYLRSRREFV